MNSNKSLCKFYNKSKVTVGDILFTFVSVILLFIVGSIFIYSMFQCILIVYYHGNIFAKACTWEAETFPETMGIVGLVVWLYIIIFTFYYIIKYISNIEITECEIKK